MQIKKLLSFILFLFLICSCITRPDNNRENEDVQKDVLNVLLDSPYIEPVLELDAVKYFSDETNKYLANYFGDPNDAFIGESINLIGKEVDFFDLKGKDLFGDEVDFSEYKNKKVLVEIAATYCSHCGEQLKYISRIKKNLGDIDILQIFANTGGNEEYIEKFYFENNHKITNDARIIQYDNELTKRFMDIGITQTPTFLFIDSGVIKTALSSFNSKYLDRICDIGFTDTIKREKIKDTNGRTLDEFYRTVNTLMNEINAEKKEYLNSLFLYNSELTANVAGQKFKFDDLTIDLNGLFKIDSYDEYSNQNVIIFGLSRNDTSDLDMDIRIINEFLKNNDDIKGLIVFLDDTTLYLTSTSDLYLKSSIKADCEKVSSDSPIPQQVKNIYEKYIIRDEIPMILFIENNYITGLCGGPYSLNSLDTLKDMFFGPDCITLKENLNQN